VVPDSAFAVGESSGASGRDVLTAIAAGYEVLLPVGNELDRPALRERFSSTATDQEPMAQRRPPAKLFGLSKEKIVPARGGRIRQQTRGSSNSGQRRMEQALPVGASRQERRDRPTLARNDSSCDSTDRVRRQHGCWRLQRQRESDKAVDG